jgi:uncharacterized phage protein gp47/JayE
MADLYQPSGSEELSQRFLRDVRLASIQAGNDDVPIGYGSDFWLTSQALAGMGLLGFRNINLSEADQNVLTAEGTALNAIMVGYGIPEVPASVGTGKVIITVSGVTTIPTGQAFLYPNGKSGRVVGTYINPANLSEINVECTTTGTSGNLKSGESIRFIGPPINLAETAKVSQNTPITGGTDTENDSRKRTRILNVLKNKPSGGNWSHVRQIVLDYSGGVQNCFCHPALGGPSSLKTVPVKDFDLDNNDYSRSVSDALLSSIRDKLQSELPVGTQVIVQSCVSEYTDMTLKLTIPNSSLSGGNGQGWTDIVPWPYLVGGDSGKISLSSPNATYDTLTLSANTTTPPIDGQTHISWWSSTDRKFYSGLIVSHSGSSGAWVVSVDRPLVDSTGSGPISGDYVSPLCQNITGYGESYISMMRNLGPGENTVQASRLPRASRHPNQADEAPSSVTNSTLKTLISKYPEITDFSFGYILKSAPTVPGNTQTAPNILIPRRFAVYPI